MCYCRNNLLAIDQKNKINSKSIVRLVFSGSKVDKTFTQDASDILRASNKMRLARRTDRGPTGQEFVLARTNRIAGWQHAARNPC
jgi:hypothetical protein